MLTGKRAFAGASVRDTLANVAQSEPDWEALPADTPESIRTLLTRSLVKDRRRRIGDMAVALYLLEDAVQPARRSTTPGGSGAGGRSAAIAAGVLAGVLITGGAWWSLRARPGTPRPSSVRFEIAVPAPQGFAQNTRASRSRLTAAALSIALAANHSSCSARSMISSLDPSPAPRAPTARSSRPMAVGSRSLAPAGSTEISTEGGAVVELCAIGAPHRGGAWGADDTILFATADRRDRSDARVAPAAATRGADDTDAQQGRA